MKIASYVSQENDAKALIANVLKASSATIEEIQDQYQSDMKPWVIGYSGGKDSTAVLQLIFYALSSLPRLKLKKEIHVLANDTLVENPNIARYVDSQLQQIESAGKRDLFSHNPDLFNVIKVTPKLEDMFWVNLIGKGYPSPNRWFRWCTERMKINPTSDYILQTVSRHGSAIIVLGTRKAESTNRANSMRQYEVQGLRLRKHTLPNAYVYAPIAEWTTQEVWTYLLHTENPWRRSNNQEILDLYRSASDVTECPLVIDDTTPSCGNSRFGCWVCTVVEEDKSMRKMIRNGEEWMLPLLEFRDWLRDLRNDTSARYNRRRNGQPGLGPFTIETRKLILERLLRIELEIGQTLISTQELAAIQYQWNYDGYFDGSVSELVSKIRVKSTMSAEMDGYSRRKDEYELLSNVCREMNVNPDHIKELLEVERSKLTFLRRHGLFDDIKAKIESFTNNSDS
jgi:DNA sulfur modification protein DndC